MKRLISAILGVVLIGIVIFLGIKSSKDTLFIVPFGLASALIAPIGVSALGYSIKKEDPTLKKLALVPEIDSLIEKAETEAEKIERLKREKEELLNYIQNETKRIAIEERKKILETDIQRINAEYNQVNIELAEITGQKPDLKEVSDEIKKFYKLQKGIDLSDKKKACLIILGEKYVIRNILDIYRLPSMVIIDKMDELTIMLVKAIQKKIDDIVEKIKKL